MIMQKEQMIKLRKNCNIYNKENEKFCEDDKNWEVLHENVDKKKYVDLLKKYPDLLSFVLLLKSAYTDYIETYL